jgi:hypothetical protein
MVSNVGADRTSSQRCHWVPGAVTRATEVLTSGPWLALICIEERAVHICFEYRIDSATCVSCQLWILTTFIDREQNTGFRNGTQPGNDRVE